MNDFWINAELVRGGYAYVYPEYATSKHLYEYEHKARESQMGIWALPENERVKPWEWGGRRKEKIKLECLLTTQSGHTVCRFSATHCLISSNTVLPK